MSFLGHPAVSQLCRDQKDSYKRVRRVMKRSLLLPRASLKTQLRPVDYSMKNGKEPITLIESKLNAGGAGMIKARWVLFSEDYPSRVFVQLKIPAASCRECAPFLGSGIIKHFFQQRAVSAQGESRRNSPPNGRHLCPLGLAILGLSY